MFNSAIKQKILINGSNIMTYAWNVDKIRPTILVLHGWNGRGTQMFSFIDMLVDNDYGVVAFDARGHGQSDGKNTNVLESIEVIRKLSQIHGDFFAMIGHSFGAMAAVNAINRGVVCKKLVAISPPTDFLSLLRVFSHYLGLNKKAENILEIYVLKKYGIDSFEQISITGIAPKMTIPCLFIHDKDDDKVPLSQAQKAVELWGKKVVSKSMGSGAKLHITEGLGHVRILHKPPALEATIGFLRGL